MATCNDCGGEILHVKDAWTGASFPIDAEPVRTRGFELRRPAEGERTQRAVLVDTELYRPHSVSCSKRESALPPEEIGPAPDEKEKEEDF